MSTNIQQPVSKASRELLLADIQNFNRSAEDRNASAEYELRKVAAGQAKAEKFLAEAQEFRDRVDDTLRVIALIDIHNSSLSTTPKEN
jgi:hypothetical protein